MLCFIYFLGGLRRFQHCTGHITTGSWKGRGNQNIQFVRVLYCKLPTNGKQLPAFPLEAVSGTEPRPQRWEARVLPLCHRGPCIYLITRVLHLGDETRTFCQSVFCVPRRGEVQPNLLALSPQPQKTYCCNYWVYGTSVTGRMFAKGIYKFSTSAASGF